MRKKRVIFLLLASAAVIAVGGMLFSFSARKSPAAQPEKTAAPAAIAPVKPASAVQPVSRQIKTEEDIREVYGRLEVVTLTSGKCYRGAVVSVGEEYTMVTAQGVVRIPMNEVSARDIIR